MATEKKDKVVEFISKLVQLTQDRKVKWRAVQSPRAENKTAFEAEIDDRRLRVYKYTDTMPNPDYQIWQLKQSSILTISGLGLAAPPTTLMINGIILEVIDSGLVVYSFDRKTGLGDLVAAASASAAGVDELIASVLAME